MKSMKHDNYEPALVKARKLAALADPASGASKGGVGVAGGEHGL